jgi:hypothetical protein
MIDFSRQRLGDPSLAQYFDTTSDISKEVLEKNGRAVGYFYWRVGYGYQGLSGNTKNVHTSLEPNPQPHLRIGDKSQ